MSRGRRKTVRAPMRATHFHLSDKKWRFLRARGSYESDAATERALRIGARSAERWKRRDPVFREAYALMETDPVAFAASGLSALSPAAIRSIADALEESHPTTARLRAGQVALEFADGQFITGPQRAVRLVQAPSRSATKALPAAPAPVALPPPAAPAPAPAPPGPEVPKPRRAPTEFERALGDAIGLEEFRPWLFWHRGQTEYPREKIEHAAELDLINHRPFVFDRFMPDVVVLGDGVLCVIATPPAKPSRCRVAAKGRCPLTKLVDGKCDLWSATWLDQTRKPAHGERRVTCDVYHLMIRLQQMTLMLQGGFGANLAYPVIAVGGDPKLVRKWRQRVDAWNGIVLDPKMRIKLLVIPEASLKAAQRDVAKSDLMKARSDAG